MANCTIQIKVAIRLTPPPKQGSHLANTTQNKNDKCYSFLNIYISDAIVLMHYSIGMKCNSLFHEQHRETRRHMITFAVIKNMVITNVIGRCNSHDVVDAVLLSEHTLCVNPLFACS